MYNMAMYEADLQSLRNSGAEIFTIGYSVLGRPIQCAFKGNMTGGQVLIMASMHAREYVTTPVVIEMMKNYNGNAGVWCVPMVNPDGVMLCTEGLSSIGNDENLKRFVLNVNGGSQNFNDWKANIRAVDLNVNYNAKWGEGSQNVTYPSPGNYIGRYPVSEPENIALRDLTNRIQPGVTLSYHARGEVLYWGFECIKPYFDKAMRISDVTGYPLLESVGSSGGYKDWYTATTFKLGLTVEVARADEPFPISLDRVPEIYQQNKDVLMTAGVIAEEIENGI